MIIFLVFVGGLATSTEGYSEELSDVDLHLLLVLLLEQIQPVTPVDWC